MKIYKKVYSNKIPNEVNLKELSEYIQKELGLFDEETGELEGIDFSHHDWDINGHYYKLKNIPLNLISIRLDDDFDLVPIIFNQEYESVSTLKEAHDVILEILEYESDEGFEKYHNLTLEETFQKNIDNFPRTDYWPHVGYILTDGECLDFSGGGSSRTLDHRKIFDGSTYGMQSFMIHGNIRIDVSQKINYAGIDIYTEPTKPQYRTLQKLFRDIDEMGGTVQIDLSNGIEEFDERNKIYYMKDRQKYSGEPMDALNKIMDYYGREFL